MHFEPEACKICNLYVSPLSIKQMQQINFIVFRVSYGGLAALETLWWRLTFSCKPVDTTGLQHCCDKLWKSWIRPVSGQSEVASCHSTAPPLCHTDSRGSWFRLLFSAPRESVISCPATPLKGVPRATQWASFTQFILICPENAEHPERVKFHSAALKRSETRSDRHVVEKFALLLSVSHSQVKMIRFCHFLFFFFTVSYFAHEINRFISLWSRSVFEQTDLTSSLKASSHTDELNVSSARK